MQLLIIGFYRCKDLRKTFIIYLGFPNNLNNSLKKFLVSDFFLKFVHTSSD